ncbi:hypothetical protein GQ44DRAFT_689197 [Phaeosphaeriaceae sp. PMI808]|nr:hypothetical protein GQ44DRAFT_689197 [Phaeosphaeriaceae sp. PMI808]
MIAPRTPSSEGSPSPQISAEPTAYKSFTCVLCAQRKVKCDRLTSGCKNCIKARVPCIYKSPTPPRRRKKGERNIEVTARLRLYEAALLQAGVDPEKLVIQGLSNCQGDQNSSKLDEFFQPMVPEPPQNTDLIPKLGVFVREDGRSRYLDNGIWTSLQNEFRDPKQILDESSDEGPSDANAVPSVLPTPNDTGFLFKSLISPANLQNLHPNPLQIFKLWQLYLDNINPLVKIFHAPTVQQLILEASGNLKCITRSVEALLFAIYCITVGSIADKDCIAMLGQSKSTALGQFRLGAQYSLMNANLLKTSDLMVLQAFTLFILSFQNFDGRIIWVWSGVAHRIAMWIGLHRDGMLLGLPPFEVEIRRRVWWQILLLEGYAQKSVGAGAGADSMVLGDVSMPSNLNDSDLFHGMKEMPKEHEGATEMMFFLIRCHLGEFLKRSANPRHTYDGVWNKLTSSTVDVATKGKAIDELEALIQRKFLRCCDPSIPWHMMCSQLGKVIGMCKFPAMRHALTLCYTEYNQAKLGRSTKDDLFDLALQITASQNLVYTMEGLQGFMWHVNLHFQWKTFIYLLSELRHRTKGADVEQAWKEIEKTYIFHPGFDKELARRALPVAVSNLTLKAWEAYVSGRDTVDAEPYFIQTIRHQQQCRKLPRKPSPHDGPSTQPSSNKKGLDNDIMGQQTDPPAGLKWSTENFSTNPSTTPTFSECMPLDATERMDWAQWDNLFVDFQTADSDNIPLDVLGFNFEM